MNIKEALEIYKEIDSKRCRCEMNYCEHDKASGYLEAISQVQHLVETLETINRQCHGDAVVYSRMALAKWKQLQGEK